MIAILVGVKWYCIELLISIFLMTSDIKHLLMCLLTLCIYSVDSCLLKFFAHFLNRWLFLLPSFKNSLHILDIEYLSDVWLQILYSVGCLFNDNVLSFTNFKILMKFILSIFSSLTCSFVIISKNSLPNVISGRFIPMFPLTTCAPPSPPPPTSLETSCDLGWRSLSSITSSCYAWA